MAAQRRGLPSPPRAVTAVSCVLLAALLCATQARAGTPWQVANDLRMNVTGPPLMLSAENQTLISVVEQVLEDPYGAGPIVFKTAEAMLYTLWSNLWAYADVTIPFPAYNLPLIDQSNLLLVWANDSATMVLAFEGTPDASTQNATQPAFSPPTIQPWLQGNFAGAYVPADVSDPFQALIDGAPGGYEPLSSSIGNLTGDQAPLRVVCTGYRSGGAYAELCAIWAAVTYPSANVRTIAFGAPQVGNTNFNYALQQLGDLTYLWTTPTDVNFTNGTNADYYNPGTVYLLNATDTAANAAIPANSLEQYVYAIQEVYNNTNEPTTYVQNSTSGSSGIISRISGFVGSFTNTVTSVSSLTMLADTLFETVKAYLTNGPADDALSAASNGIADAARANSTGFPPLLGKSRYPATSSCNAYTNGSNTIAPGSATLSNNATGAYVAVAWLNASKTAVIAFRGTSSTVDWEYDFMGFLTNGTQDSVLQQTFPGVQVHEGFLDQFLSLTDNATSPENNITAVIYQMSGGQQPFHVLVTGHSLGAGLAAVGAPYFALQWPGADVTCTTFGSPEAGNFQFTQAFRALVGRQLRYIHALDVVPYLPSLDTYAHVPFGIWIPTNATVVLEDRPPEDISDLNWVDHDCRANYEANMYATRYVTAPNPIPAERTS